MRQVLRCRHDLLVKTMRPDDEDGGLRYGTTAALLLRHCPCPLMLVDPQQVGPFRRIVAAVDLAGDEAEMTLNERIVDLGAAVADISGLPLDLLHAWYAFDGQVLRQRLDEGVYRMWVAALRSDYTNACQALAARRAALMKRRPRGQVIGDVHLEEGVPAKVIPRFVNDESVQLLVMGSLARSGLGGYLIGNTAERIARQLPCSLLAIKSDTFVSPIGLPDEERDETGRGRLSLG